MIAPISTENMAVKEYPCAVINGFSPCASKTNTVPAEYILRYDEANPTALKGQPKSTTTGVAVNTRTKLNTMPMAVSITDEVLKTLTASLSSPAPSFMLARGAPPSPTRLANAWIINVTGRTIPSAARASIPVSSICATYILSTMLYKKVIS